MLEDFTEKENEILAELAAKYDTREMVILTSALSLYESVANGQNIVIPNWRDISEAPKDGTKLLVRSHIPQIGIVRGWWHEERPGRWGFAFVAGRNVDPTHFIPLSSIPTPEAGE